MHDIPYHLRDAAVDADAPGIRWAIPQAGDCHFVIIGAQKSGTTILCAMLAQHPDIAISDRKETDFFARRPDGDYSFASYKRCFSRTGTWLGEASPIYSMRHEFDNVPERMAAAIPNARLIFIVRDPVARAVSQYQHEYLSGRVPDPTFPGPLEAPLRHCVETSCYFRQITPFMKFFSRERLLLLDFEKLKADPQSVIDQVCGFLGLSATALSKVAESARNSAEDRGATPLFILRRWNAPSLEAIRRVAPPAIVTLVKRAYRLAPRRVAPPLPPAAIDFIRDGVRADASLFRAFAGQEFEEWTV